MNQYFDILYMTQAIPMLSKYIYLTVSLAVVSMGLGLIIAFVLLAVSTYKVRGLNGISKLYVSFFRGTPLLVQLFLLYYGLPQVVPVFRGVSAFNAAIIGLSMNGSAYMVEILRGAVSSVDKGQMEAALSTGMTHLQGMRRIVLPQAVRVAVPSLGNTFVDLLKSSSLAFTLGVAEILAQAQMSAAATYRFFENYMAVAMIYWGIVLLFNRIQRALEKKLNEAY
jgi:putative amino-acid transport system permease protein